MTANVLTADDLLRRLEELNAIGAALSQERDMTRLLEVILAAAKGLTNADGGTLYVIQEIDGERILKFEIVRTDSLNIAMGGSSGVAIPFSPIRLVDDTGAPNNSMVVTYAALHDCGKVTAPVHVVDKATKLQTIFDRIHLVDTRFEVVKRDAEIAFLQAKLGAGGDPKTIARLEAEFQERMKRIDEDREFLRRHNTGGESMAPELRERVRRIGTGYTWRDVDGKEAPFLSEDEIDNLCIKAGTLTAREREIINHHIVVTIKMLESLPWPKHLKNVPEYAGGHHERMDGKGYPRGLTREQMSVQARVMGIADIFEALTAADRPYKKGKTLTESLHILGKFKLNGHIDPDLFDVFVREKIYLEYANQVLDPARIDTVDESQIPGYDP
ncbi:MAG: hypothetical protein EXR78_00435 [Deltaproteobacteria bacterium]|nr:hypothetical protein [Deltaproteobacteria bacterium]